MRRAEAQCEDKHDGHYGVDEACGGKFVHAVVAHHQCVGEAQYNSANLSHDERQSERKQGLVMIAVFVVIVCHIYNNMWLKWGAKVV